MSISTNRIVKKFVVVADEGWWTAGKFDTFDEAVSWIDYQYDAGVDAILSVIECLEVAKPA